MNQPGPAPRDDLWTAWSDRMVDPLVQDEQERSDARGAVLLCAQLMLFMVVLWPAWWALLPRSAGVLAPLAFLPLAAMGLARRGRWRSAVYACAAVVALHWAVVAWASGGVTSVAVIGLSGLPLFPAMYRDARGALGTVVGGLLVALLLAALEGAGFVPAAAPTGARWLGLVLVVVLAQGAGITVAVLQVATFSDAIALELAEANRDLAAARDRARAASASKSMFLASMSHELRTPMNAVLGVTGLLIEEDLGPRQREHVATIRDAVGALVDIVEDILDFSRIEAGHLRIEASPFEPVALLRQVADLLRVRAREKDLRLDVEIDPRVPGRLLGDSGRLRQILFNLVGNAVKYTDRGTVAVRLRCLDRSERDVLLRLEVEDSGIGIAPEDLDRIFDRFTQVGGGLEYRAGGTGLGLSITRHLVDLMAGRLDVTSRLGVGSTFRVDLRLPIVGAEVAPTPDGAPPPLPAARVLLAEDDPVSRKVTLAMLDRLGCVGDPAETGEEALRAASGGAYDLVLMDCEMPVLDGFQATRRLRDLGVTCPILALTGHTGPEVRARAEQAGMDDVLEKPVRLETLHRSLARWLLER